MKKMPSYSLGVWYFISDAWRATHSIVGGDNYGLMAQGSLRKQTEKATMRKPVSSTCVSMASESAPASRVLPGSLLSLLLQMNGGWNKPLSFPGGLWSWNFKSHHLVVISPKQQALSWIWRKTCHCQEREKGYSY